MLMVVRMEFKKKEITNIEGFNYLYSIQIITYFK